MLLFTNTPFQRNKILRSFDQRTVWNSLHIAQTRCDILSKELEIAAAKIREGEIVLQLLHDKFSQIKLLQRSAEEEVNTILSISQSCDIGSPVPEHLSPVSLDGDDNSVSMSPKSSAELSDTELEEPSPSSSLYNASFDFSTQKGRRRPGRLSMSPPPHTSDEAAKQVDEIGMLT